MVEHRFPVDMPSSKLLDSRTLWSVAAKLKTPQNLLSLSGGGFGGDSEGESENIEKISSGFRALDSPSNLEFASSLVAANECLLGRDLLDQPFHPPSQMRGD